MSATFVTVTDRCHATPARDVVFTFSYVNWTGARRRGMNMCQDRLVTHLLQDPRVDRLLIAGPYRAVARRVGARLLGRTDEPLPDGARAVVHEPLRLRRVDPTSIRAIERAYRRYDASLRAAVQRAGLRDPAVITMHPLIGGFADLEWAGPVTFYCTDDWSAAPAYAPWHDAYREGYARIRARRRAMVAVSQPILDRVRPTGPSRLVPNGVEPAEWAAPGPPPAWFAALPGPRLLYLGTLDGRLDLDAVRATALRFAHGSIALVGTLADPERIGSLADLPNVHVRQRVPRGEVPALVAASDACLIPHRRTPFTEAMSPLKAYEYLAGGRPVAATDLPPLRGLGPALRLVEPGGDFAAAVVSALSHGPAAEDERRRFIAGAAWSSRHGEVVDFALR